LRSADIPGKGEGEALRGGLTPWGIPHQGLGLEKRTFSLAGALGSVVSAEPMAEERDRHGAERLDYHWAIQHSG